MKKLKASDIDKGFQRNYEAQVGKIEQLTRLHIDKSFQDGIVLECYKKEADKWREFVKWWKKERKLLSSWQSIKNIVECVENKIKELEK